MWPHGYVKQRWNPLGENSCWLSLSLALQHTHIHTHTLTHTPSLALQIHSSSTPPFPNFAVTITYTKAGINSIRQVLSVFDRDLLSPLTWLQSWTGKLNLSSGLVLGIARQGGRRGCQNSWVPGIPMELERQAKQSITLYIDNDFATFLDASRCHFPNAQKRKGVMA